MGDCMNITNGSCPVAWLLVELVGAAATAVAVKALVVVVVVVVVVAHPSR